MIGAGPFDNEEVKCGMDYVGKNWASMYQLYLKQLSTVLPHRQYLLCEEQ